MMKKLYRLVIVALLSVMASNSASAQTIYPGPEGWRTAKPEEMGYSSDKLKAVRQAIIDNTHATGFCIIVGGKMIFEYGDLHELSYIASCRKSILSMMYGKYVENGKIDLSKTMADLGIDDVQGLSDQEKEATVLDLITCRSGIYHPASYAGDSKNKPARGTYRRGEYFLYNNWDFNVAGEVFEMMTGKNIYDAFGEDIAKPIQMQDWKRKRQKKSGNKKASKYLAYPFHFSTRDMARIGYLMLRNGKWGDKQVISEDWIKTSTAAFTPFEEVAKNRKGTRFSYGYMWWIFDEASPAYLPQYKGAYTASGMMGQRITVIPELDMVVAMKTNSRYGRKTKGSEYLKILDAIVTAQAE